MSEEKEETGMSDVRVAVQKSPRRIRVTDGETLLEHARILQLRAQGLDVFEAKVGPALQRVEEAKHRLKAAEVAAEQARLELGPIELQGQEALSRFYTLLRRSTPQVRTLAERYHGGVMFPFDSNGTSVWVVAVFDNGAPPALREMSDGGCPWPAQEDDQEDGGEEKTESE